MSICAPTPLLISTGPLSATRCRPCSMTAISCWQATSPGKVATAPHPTPTPTHSPPLPPAIWTHPPTHPPLFVFVLSVLVGAEWVRARGITTLLCLHLTSWHQLHCSHDDTMWLLSSTFSVLVSGSVFIKQLSWVKTSCSFCESRLHWSVLPPPPPLLTQSWNIPGHLGTPRLWREVSDQYSCLFPSLSDLICCAVVFISFGCVEVWNESGYAASSHSGCVVWSWWGDGYNCLCVLIIRACFAHHRLHTRTLSNLKLFLTCLNILGQSILNVTGFSIDINLLIHVTKLKYRSHAIWTPLNVHRTKMRCGLKTQRSS